MPATKEIHVFGHRDDPSVEIALPYDLENGAVSPYQKQHDFRYSNPFVDIVDRVIFASLWMT